MRCVGDLLFQLLVSQLRVVEDEKTLDLAAIWGVI